jgi:two-component system phosphate regulon sensor histidine kinase PhoR
LFTPEKKSIDLFGNSVIQRFSYDEVNQVLKSALKKYIIKEVPFEFAIAQNDIVGEEMQSAKFAKYYADTANNLHIIYPLIPASGSSLESLSMNEVLVLIVPNDNKIVLREIFWFILGSIIFTLIITSAFYITIRSLLKQKNSVKSNRISSTT